MTQQSTQQPKQFPGVAEPHQAADAGQDSACHPTPVKYRAGGSRGGRGPTFSYRGPIRTTKHTTH